MEVEKPQLSPDEQSKLTADQRIAGLRQDSARYDELIQRIQALPGVAAAGGISVLPLGTAMRSASRFLVEGEPVPDDGIRPVAETRNVSPGYFAAMGIPLRMGRPLDAHDYASQNIIVNEALAQRFWPSGDAVGKRMNFCTLAPEPCWTTIVGVVANVHQYGLDAAPTFDSYGNAGWMPYMVVRSTSDPVVLAQAIVQEIHLFDPSLPVAHVLTLDNLLSESISPRRFSTFLLGLFASLAVLLAMIGVYAVMAYTVRVRSNEIAIRMALGAKPQNIWWLVLGGGARLVFAGITIGMFGAFVLSRLISTLLYGVTSSDALTFVLVPLFVASAAMFACYVPARQAMKIDPMVALRRE
jgi:predicted permease